jgi:hypothetical protein
MSVTYGSDSYYVWSVAYQFIIVLQRKEKGRPVLVFLMVFVEEEDRVTTVRVGFRESMGVGATNVVCLLL